MEKYTFIKEIGSGSFGKVFLVRSKQGGLNYVVKQVDLTKLDKKQSRSASKEVEVLAKLRHNNIVSYKESYERNNQLNIVLEYCENGDLHDKIKEKRLSGKLFGENEILDYFVQICLALEYIHSQRILHRDLKTKNIFLTKANTIKLGDFGIAKVLENSFELAQTCIGSPFYVSPEICESKPYNKKSDVWALGCVLYELSTLKYAFVAKNVKSLLTKILTGIYSPLPTSLNIHIRSLISVMLKPDPKDRPSVKEILEKRFLIKRRATFICKARSDFCKRSKSGELRRNYPTMVTNNENSRCKLKKDKAWLSCMHLNHLEDSRKYNMISKPESKYKPLNNSQGSRANRKPFSDDVMSINIFQDPEDDKLKDHHSKFELKSGRINKKSNLEKIKNLPKVDSKYYDLIAGDPKKNLGKPDEFNLRNQDGNKEMIEVGGVEEVLDASVTPEHRKKWMMNTLQRDSLLAVLNDAELLGSTLSFLNLERPSEKPKVSVDDMLSLEPSEMTENVLLPVQINQRETENHLQLLRREIHNLRQIFILNNNYKIDDLIRLVDESKKTVNQTSHNHLVYDTEGESVFYDLEYRKMELEQKVGFSRFLRVYGKMKAIIDGNLDLGWNAEGTKTYIIPRFNVSDDSNELMTTTWKSIIDILGDEQQYLLDIWELVVSECFYYHKPS